MTESSEIVNELEVVQRNYGLTYDEKENLITTVVAKDGTDIGRFLLKVSQANFTDYARILQIVEQYPKAFVLVLFSSALIDLLHHIEAQTDETLISNHISMFSVALKLVDESTVISSTALAALETFSLRTMNIGSVGLAERAHNLLLQIATRKSEPSDLLRALKMALTEQTRNSTAQLRIFTFIVELCRIIPTYLLLCESYGLICAMLEICKSSDVLVVMNALEQLEAIGNLPNGLNTLSNCGAISWLASIPDSVDPLVKDCAMRTLAVLIGLGAESKESSTTINLQTLLNAATEKMHGIDDTQRLTGLSIISDLCASSLPALQLAMEGESVKAWIALLGKGKADLGSAALYALSKTLSANQASEVEGQSLLLQLKQRLFEAIGPARGASSTVSYLISVARQPVSPLRLAAMMVLTSAAQLPWGLRSLLPARGARAEESELYRFLQDRETEHEKEGKDMKFTLITTVRNAAGVELLATEVVAMLDKLIAQGPYYRPAMTEELLTM